MSSRIFSGLVATGAAVLLPALVLTFGIACTQKSAEATGETEAADTQETTDVADIAEATDDAYMASYIGADADKVGTDHCLMCHGIMDPSDKSNHIAIFEGDEENSNHGFGCEACHGPGGSHNGNPLGILQLAKMPQSEVTGLCSSCHAERGAFALASWVESTHNAAGSSCVTCHAGHSENAAFLVEEDAISLCNTCHADKVEALHEGTHGQAEGEEKICTDCHNPHT